jgi:hypothetical protein
MINNVNHLVNEVRSFEMEEDQNGLAEFPESLAYYGKQRVVRHGCGVVITASEDKSIKLY